MKPGLIVATPRRVALTSVSLSVGRVGRAKRNPPGTTSSASAGARGEVDRRVAVAWRSHPTGDHSEQTKRRTTKRRTRSVGCLRHATATLGLVHSTGTRRRVFRRVVIVTQQLGSADKRKLISATHNGQSKLSVEVPQRCATDKATLSVRESRKLNHH